MLLALLGAASAAEPKLLLEVILNGRATGQIGQFIERNGALYAMPSELTDLGFVVPPALAKRPEPIALSSLPGVKARANLRRQTLEVTASDAGLLPEVLSTGSRMRLAPLSQASFGAVLNYDILGTFTGQQATGGGLFDFRAFTPYGVFDSSELGNFTPAPGQESVVRLGTSYTYSEPDNLRRWRGGDVISGGLAWSRPVRLGGAQVTTDFALRPDLVTYPIPVISSSVTVPSTVDVLVNGIRQFGQPVQPGPFQIPTLPYVNGAGEVVVTVQDALGRQTVITTPFYTATQLLKPGLASYAFEGGALRLNYGLESNDYRSAAGDGTFRYGVTSWLTAETHVEVSESLALAGAGAAVQVANLGVLDADLAVSRGRGGISIGPKPSSARSRPPLAWWAICCRCCPRCRTAARYRGARCWISPPCSPRP